MIRQILHLSFFILLFSLTVNVSAQPDLQKDYSYTLEIPSVISMESSPAHMYLLSDTEGMVVFRNRPDSLQWLYTSAGMEGRGNTMTADIRFAYLFGSDRRLTVLEPTSVLGVYSSTLLPEQPLDAKRVNNKLYVAMGTKGLGQISLSTPVSVDSTVALVERSRLRDERIIDLEARMGQLFVLASEGRLFVFNQGQDGIQFDRELKLSRSLDHIFIVGEILLGSDPTGTVYEIDGTGNMEQMGSIGEPVKKIESWRSWLLIKGDSNRLWTSYQNRTPVIWKEDRNAGNYFTVTNDQLWLCEYNQLSRIVTTEQSQSNEVITSAETTTERLRLKEIKNVTVPYPRPVLLSLELEGNFPAENVQFSYQSNIENVHIRGKGFYWQPQANDVGTHYFKIVAASADGQIDSTSFRVNVSSFNAPPRFTPVRPVTIPMGEPFTLSLKATDPDGMNPDLVRYLGVDLPEGSQIDESSGQFTWTPSARQSGENRFQVIATDQYGAASQINISIRVIEISRSEERSN